MRFATTLQQGRARLGVVDGDSWIDLGLDLRAALEAGTDLVAAGRNAIASGTRLALASQSFAPLVPEPGKTICLGLNYFDHAKEGGRDKPDYPWFFYRGKSSLMGHGQPGVVPKVSFKFDYEAELGVALERLGSFRIERGELEIGKWRTNCLGRRCHGTCLFVESVTMRPIAVNDSGIRSFHLDFDEDEFKWIVIDNVMFDAQLAGICLSRDEGVAHEVATGVDEELAGGHGNNHVVHLMPMPAGVTSR